MNGWVDIHCHVLPGVDDSAVDMETSLDMLRSAVDEGLEQLVVTPTIRPMTVLRSCACMNAPSLVSAVAAAGLPIDLRLVPNSVSDSDSITLLLILRHWADFVASDGHDVRKRRLSIRAAAEQLNELVGTQRTYQLLVENPACVMTGELVEPYRPQPVRRKGGIGQWIQRRFSSSAATRG